MLDQLRHLAVEEGDQQRGDVGAVDVGVGHDDDLLVAQVLVAVVRAGAAAERLHQVGELLVLRELVLAGEATLRILPRSGSTAWVARSRACLAEPPAESPSTMKSSEPARRAVGAVGELAGQAQLARRGLARDFLFLAAAQPLLGALDHPVEQLVGLRRIAGEPVVEGVLIAFSTMRCASAVASRSLVWPWNSGSRMNTESMQPAPTITSSLVIGGGALALADALGMVLAGRAAARCAGPISCVPPSGVGMVLQ